MSTDILLFTPEVKLVGIFKIPFPKHRLPDAVAYNSRIFIHDSHCDYHEGIVYEVNRSEIVNTEPWKPEEIKR